MPRDAAIRWLHEHANPDGSWGYLPGQAGRPEPTLLALAALGAQARDPARTVAWLASAELGYTELLLPAALARIPEAQELRVRCVDAMLAWAQLRAEQDRSVIAHDATLIGWGWRPDTSSWVEPTAYALLSLKRMGHAHHPRVREAELMLRDRVCQDGGWNYGNTRVFDVWLESDPIPTAWACMALGPDPLVGPALALLRAFVENEPSALNTSLSILAHTAHGAPVDAIVPQLLARQASEGGFRGRVEITALAALALSALEEVDHVFAHTP